MLKASALYMVIVITLVIGVICSALIVAAYLYKSQYQAKFRTGQLQNNLNSGITILLNSRDSIYKDGHAFSLFNGDADSINLKKTSWGIFDVCSASASISRDTLYKVFSLANSIDSAKWGALYLIDEDRPVSVSGNTLIRGNIYIPKAGIRTAYVDNQAYTGDQNIVNGKTFDSERRLPPLSAARLGQLQKQLSFSPPVNDLPAGVDSIARSFLKPTLAFSFGKKAKTISHVSLNGNIVLYSDTTLVIDSTASLNNVLVFAKGILVKSGFRGSCQLFAADSISVERDCNFNYPSCLGILRFTTGNTVGLPAKLNVGDRTDCEGLIFSYQKDDQQLPPVISLGKKTRVQGQVYSMGILNLRAETTINGSVFTKRFLYQSEFTRYENYLINVSIDSRALSPYYLSSDLTPVAGKPKKILQWLEAN
ncbi:hypothetical protein SNE26_28140 [Mucilaginibacter sp. cycad4]|uniref:hypothetical protein n=1 Tax=Mucilaginibacter sp. cycad4 TaxID=3342096 RepID=UPI002AAB1BBA|nr:hypothetical protein [Mucilaginibacter gossypii]WPU99883.1 hypothetical protein SNE26_28140 [Mucilaginibacter gossypii]